VTALVISPAAKKATASDSKFCEGINTMNAAWVLYATINLTGGFGSISMGTEALPLGVFSAYDACSTEAKRLSAVPQNRSLIARYDCVASQTPGEKQSLARLQMASGLAD